MLEPTKGELEILQILWENGPSTVRFVNTKLNEVRTVNYTSTLKHMQIMVEKKLLSADKSSMKHVYHVVEEKKTKNFLLDKFVERIYNGSSSKLIMALFGNKKVSKEEIKEIKDLLDQIED